MAAAIDSYTSRRATGASCGQLGPVFDGLIRIGQGIERLEIGLGPRGGEGHSDESEHSQGQTERVPRSLWKQMILHVLGLGATVAHAILPLRGPNTVTYSRDSLLRGLQVEPTPVITRASS